MTNDDGAGEIVAVFAHLGAGALFGWSGNIGDGSSPIILRRKCLEWFELWSGNGLSAINAMSRTVRDERGLLQLLRILRCGRFRVLSAIDAMELLSARGGGFCAERLGLRAASVSATPPLERIEGWLGGFTRKKGLSAITAIAGMSDFRHEVGDGVLRDGWFWRIAGFLQLLRIWAMGRFSRRVGNIGDGASPIILRWKWLRGYGLWE